jgi:ABC-type branched-subunit amino acid transport system substrate-binding protein
MQVREAEQIVSKIFESLGADRSIYQNCYRVRLFWTDWHLVSQVELEHADDLASFLATKVWWRPFYFPNSDAAKAFAARIQKEVPGVRLEQDLVSIQHFNPFGVAYAQTASDARRYSEDLFYIANAYANHFGFSADPQPLHEVVESWREE